LLAFVHSKASADEASTRLAATPAMAAVIRLVIPIPP
jgi:hypothetical protein